MLSKKHVPVYVTKTFLPPVKEYLGYVNKIWKSGWVTNEGELDLQLQEKLKKYFGVKYLYLVDNATSGLLVAIKALGFRDEVITTPFSYVATTSALSWMGCQPIFADINPKTYCIDPREIEKKITKATSGILATHVYGLCCDVEAIVKISKKHHLPVIYDAAHCFGVKYKGESILKHGDVSVVSFHATKLFHTFEGGAVITNDKTLADKIYYMRKFGHKSSSEPHVFLGVGINAKMSEAHAAMGLCLLPKIDFLIAERKKLSQLYDKYLENLKVELLPRQVETEPNYIYYPVLFPTENLMLKVIKKLNENKIYPRRYFYPSLTKLKYVPKQAAPIAENIAARILCLPLYNRMAENDVKRVCKVIYSAMLI